MSEHDGGGASFKDLFEATGMRAGRQQPLSLGDRVSGVVAHITKEAVFVDLDGKRQAYFDRIDLEDADGKPTVDLGQKVEGLIVVLDEGAGQIKLGRSLSRDSGAEETLAALHRGVVVEGKVTATNKGGLVVELGPVRAFCPVSQIDVTRVEDTSEWVGRTLEFEVSELKGRDVVVSRRALLRRRQDEARTRAIAELRTGEVRNGRVTSVRDFGLFVDLGGVEGLIPLRELSHVRQQAAEVASVGDAVTVQVLEIEQKDGKPRITLSLRSLSTDPWDAIEQVAPQGRVVSGMVTRVEEHGVFVRLTDEIEGRIAAGELDSSAAYAPGQAVLVSVRSVDRGRHRVALAPAQPNARAGEVASIPALAEGAIVRGRVDRIERYGVFLQVEGIAGRAGRGLVPREELDSSRGEDLRRKYPLGTELTAKVLETGEGRLKLSVRRAVEDVERADFDAYRADQAGKGLGSFGDLLKGKIKG